jgi:rhodanese-related sulfurtransferase
MKRTYALVAGILAGLLSVPAAWAYDADLAAGFARMFEPVHGMKAGKELHLIKPDQVVERLKKGEAIVALDVRTPAEFGLFAMTTPDALTIPLNELFQPENLERIPTDKLVLVVCKSGARATAAGTALRFIGFDNVYVLKGGLKALEVYVDPKTANMPLEGAK